MQSRSLKSRHEKVSGCAVANSTDLQCIQLREPGSLANCVILTFWCPFPVVFIGPAGARRAGNQL